MADDNKGEIQNRNDSISGSDEEEGYEEEISGTDEEHEIYVKYPDEYSLIAKRPINGTVPENILEFFHSYAYDCRRYFNMCVIDKNNIVFASGNLIHFYNVEENKIWFKTGSMGGGIGHITKHPTNNYITVGENGTDPPIVIYEWPSFKIKKVLEGGTSKRYFHLTYSPDGVLLASQGGEPDYFISLWNWEISAIILQCKSYVQDVYNVTFSKYIPGELTSSGIGHIKFWKMSRTFTGLKLQGETGKFGNTEISDVIAIYPMPNETVLSGCEWGNILLWDENLIKLEVSKKDKQTTHSSYISQFDYVNGELISVGSDGWIRFWFYETIDHADLPDKEPLLEVQPIYEFYIAEEEDSKDHAMLMSIKKREPDKSDDTIWYAQDANGGLWQLDLCTSVKEQVHKKIFVCHAGPIVDMDKAVWGPFIATLDISGRLLISNYIAKKLNVVHEFYDPGSQVVWLPCEIDQTGSTLICSFESGIIRMITVLVKTADRENNIKGDYTRLIQVLKPHRMPITVMSLNISQSLLVTGSKDSTIFTFSIQSTSTYPTIIPIGYVKVPSSVTCITWNPQEEATLLIGCSKGDCVEVQLPTTPESYTTTSYELVKCEPAAFKFESVKSSIEREIVKQKYEKEKEEKLERKKRKLEQLKIENPHIIIDEEAFLLEDDDDEEEEEELVLPEIYIPEVPNKILMAQYSTDGNIWLFMAGYDAGYVYEYPRPLSKKIKASKPIQARIIENAQDTEIHSCLFYKNRKYLFMGTQHGELYVCKIKEKDPLDFSDFWLLPIHDYYNGSVSKILLSHDEKILLTCGFDGNIFSFNINDDTPSKKIKIPKVEDPLPLPNNVEDIEELDHPSLEEIITRKEQNRIMAAAEQKKKEILQIIRELAGEYNKITDRNKTLLPSQQIPQFELDPRIEEDLKQQLQVQAVLIQDKLAFHVEKGTLKLQKLMDHFTEPVTCLPFAVCSTLDEDKVLYCLRELKLHIESSSKDTEVVLTCEDLEKLEASDQEEMIDEQESEDEDEIEFSEAFANESYSDLTSGIGLQINQILTKYKDKKRKMMKREKEWLALHAKKPDLATTRVDHAAFLGEAKKSIGEYSLKISAEFDVTKKKETADSKYEQLLLCRSNLYHLREDFNARLRAIRTEKERLQKEILRLTKVLKRIHLEIPAKSIKPLPNLPKLNFDIEFPEHNLTFEKYTTRAERVQQVKRQRQSVTEEQLMDSIDLEYEVLLCDDKKGFGEETENLLTLVSSSMLKVDGQSQNDLMRNLNVIDVTHSAWEREMKRFRMWRKSYEQDCILQYINNSYERLEKELKELEEQRMDVIYRCIYMNLNLLTFYEEYIVLRECEQAEFSLEQKVKQKSNERATVTLKIQTTNDKIAMQEEEIRRLYTKIKDLTAEFTKVVAENKFHNFLQKIYKKKYTAVKERDGSVDSMTQSSETSSDESDNTIDSETEHILFDENICPPGCDKRLYELAFSQREKRYTYEFQIKELQKEIEVLHKEVDIAAKSLRIIEKILKNNQEDLERFMMEKHKKMNDVNVTIVLKFHQLQHISDSRCTTDTRDCLIFCKEKLSKLYARIGELQQESHDLKEKRKNSEMHLKRIKQDLKYMESQNKKLEDEIKEKMIQKFGRKVTILNLYKTVLQRLIYDTKTDVHGIMKTYAAEIKKVKQNCKEKLVILENLIMSNTEKLSFLTVLEKEKLKLQKILKQVPISEEDMIQLELEHRADINMLEGILNNQIQQKYLLQRDIQNLRSKPGKLPSLCIKETIL